MHPEAAEWVATHRPDTFATVVEYGSLDINGGIRHLFPDCRYIGVDITAGPGVDVVADAAAWQPDEPVDVVVCCEVLEHTESWAELIESAHRALAPGGTVILTAAGPGRGQHSAHDGNALREGEWYANIEPDDLRAALSGFTDVEVDQTGLDVRAVARKP